MKTLDVPFKSISDVKKAPMDIFKEAADKNNGVYIFNRDKIAGVALTQDQYENLNKEIEALYDKLDEYIVKERLQDPDRGSIPAKDVIGADLSEIKFDESDGWE